MSAHNNNPRGKLKRWLTKYRKYCARAPLYMTVLLFIVGIIFWGGLNTTLELTNSEAFCISCHEMKDYVYQEYKGTIHDSNRTGVRATCPDCHVPKEWGYMVVRKIGATNELIHKALGSINTPEKFNAKRLKLANYVWKSMNNTDSRECRNCHAFEHMELAKQSPFSRKKHARAVTEGKTCIDCHMGIAHKIPADFDKDGKLHKDFKRTKRPCSDCHKTMTQSLDDW